MPRGADPSRRRRIRLVVALAAAVLLSGALAYTTFTAASDAVSPSQLLASATPGRHYQLSGKVAAGSGRREGDLLRFRIRDPNGRGPAPPLVYRGTGPHPLRDGREVIASGQGASGQFVGARDSRITKCPSKFTTTPPSGRKAVCLDGHRRLRRADRRADHGALRRRRRAGRRPDRPPPARRLRPPRDLLDRRPVRAVRGRARVRLRALGLLLRAGRQQLLDRHAALLPADRDVVEPAGLAAAVGLPALGLLEPGPARDPAHDAPDPALRHRRAGRGHRLLPRADGL